MESNVGVPGPRSISVCSPSKLPPGVALSAQKVDCCREFLALHDRAHRHLYTTIRVAVIYFPLHVNSLSPFIFMNIMARQV
jgi:hypothetical protein